MKKRCENCGRLYDTFDGYNNYFCCKGCKDAFEERERNIRRAADAERRQEEAEARARRQEKYERERVKYERKRDKKAEKRELAQEDSNRSLALLKKLCLFGGFVGLHALYAGKILSACIYLFAIFIAFVEPWYEALLLNVFLWAFDLLRVFTRIYTDGSGRTIRN